VALAPAATNRAGPAPLLATASAKVTLIKSSVVFETKNSLELLLPLRTTSRPLPSMTVGMLMKTEDGNPVMVPLQANVIFPPPTSAACNVPSPGPKVVQFVTIPAAWAGAAPESQRRPPASAQIRRQLIDLLPTEALVMSVATPVAAAYQKG
jgi:hypothetical protein